MSRQGEKEIKRDVHEHYSVTEPETARNMDGERQTDRQTDRQRVYNTT